MVLCKQHVLSPPMNVCIVSGSIPQAMTTPRSEKHTHKSISCPSLCKPPVLQAQVSTPLRMPDPRNMYDSAVELHSKDFQFLGNSPGNKFPAWFGMPNVHRLYSCPLGSHGDCSSRTGTDDGQPSWLTTWRSTRMPVSIENLEEVRWFDVEFFCFVHSHYLHWFGCGP